MLLMPKPGLFFDQPALSPQAFWNLGVNMRFRLGLIETVGLHGPLKEVAGSQITLTYGSSAYRKIYTTPNTTTGQILAGSSTALALIEYNPSSTPITGTRWRNFNITPVGLVAAADTLPNPSAGRIEIPPVWWFSDQEDVVVGCRANVPLEPVYSWDRNPLNAAAPLANSPLGAVGGGILNRILVLLGCTSFTDPDPSRFMTIRWSDRFDFTEWTPSDTNVSGELQLEGGSRIVGGGVTGFGVVAWTDRRMAILQETGDPSSVFSRRYIDGGRGLLANNAWCEADGRIWWLDETRTLCVYDGGRPRQIQNPLKFATVERLEDRQTARIWMEQNPEYGEIIIGYPSADSENPDAQLVYSYVEDAWSVWNFQRNSWTNRFGVIPNLAINNSGQVFQHDLDAGLPDAYVVGPPPPPGITPITPLIPNHPLAADVTPFNFQFHTNLITMQDLGDMSWRMTRAYVDHLPAPAIGAETDTLTVQMTGYGEARVTAPLLSQESRVFQQGQTLGDFRVGGKAMRISVYGQQVKSLFRFSGFDVTAAEGTGR
jgi:hypothetical protein